MSQLSFSEAEFAGKRKKTRREKFLNEMDRTVPWDYLAGEIAKHYPQEGKVGRHRISCLLYSSPPGRTEQWKWFFRSCCCSLYWRWVFRWPSALLWRDQLASG